MRADIRIMPRQLNKKGAVSDMQGGKSATDS